MIYGDERTVLHVLDRVALGTLSAVEDFIHRAIAMKTTGHDDLGAAILVAPRFDEDALTGYQHALRRETKRSVLSGLDALAHREGFVRLGVRNGLHILLVEESDGERRPLVFE